MTSQDCQVKFQDNEHARFLMLKFRHHNRIHGLRDYQPRRPLIRMQQFTLSFCQTYRNRVRLGLGYAHEGGGGRVYMWTTRLTDHKCMHCLITCIVILITTCIYMYSYVRECAACFKLFTHKFFILFIYEQDHVQVYLVTLGHCSVAVRLEPSRCNKYAHLLLLS